MMRWTVAALALLLMPLGVAGQQAPVQLMEDPAGDVQILGPDGTPTTADPTGQAALDILDAGIFAETPEILTFYLTVKDLNAASTTPTLGGITYTFDFLFGTKGYRALVYMPTGQPWEPVFQADEPRAFLMEGTPSSGYRFRESVEARTEASTNQVIVDVPRALLVDHDQAPLARGRAITDLAVVSKTGPNMEFRVPDPQGGPGSRANPPRLADVAPGDGTGPSYTLLTGNEVQRGDIFSDVVDPVRWTNGEATTLSYSVRLSNRGDAAEVVAVRLEGADPSWELAHSEVIKLGAGESRNVTVLVSIPFVHQHGKLHSFDAIFETKNGDMATARLGVYWPRIPQPAGHHDTVWFHGAALDSPGAPFDVLFAGNRGWFNAADAAIDELDAGDPITADVSIPPAMLAAFGGQTEGFAWWSLPLEPELRIGLDFDMSRLGSFSTAINLPGPVNDPSVHVQLVLEEREARRGFFLGGDDRVERTLLAYGNASYPGLQSGRLDVSMDLTPTPDADLVPHTAMREVERNLAVQVYMAGSAMAAAGFFDNEAIQYTLDPTASTMALPLFEYHEKVDLAFATDRSIELIVGDKGQERDVNPGRTVVYSFTLDYKGSAPDSFDLAVSGTNADWATILGDATIRLEPGKPRTLALAVAAPDKAFAGDTADITLTATSSSNSAVQGGIRTLTRVVTDRDIPDERDDALVLSGELTKGKESPGIGVLPLLGALLVAGWRAGRTSQNRRN